MAKDFVKLSEVTVLEEVSDTASVLVEQNGEIYRAPKTQVGGAGGIKTAIIRDSGYLNAIAGVSTMAGAAPAVTYECLNMTFEEAYQTMANGEPLQAVMMIADNGALCTPCAVAYFGDAKYGVPTLGMIVAESIFFWTADGISTTAPSSGK